MKRSILAAMVTVASFCTYAQSLPLTAGSSNPLTGDLYIDGTNGSRLIFSYSGVSNNKVLLGNTYSLFGTGSKDDFATYIRDDNPYSIWTNGSQRFFVSGNGNVGIGTTTLPAIGNYGVFALNGRSSSQGAYLSFMTNGTEVGAIASNTQLNFITASGIVTQFYTGSSQTMQIAASGNVGVGSDTPVSLFQVDDGCTKASIGDASGSGLNYGTSYMGFNASRSGTNWLTNSDGGNNGGGVVYSSIFGDMYFAAVPTTGGSGQTLTDAQVKNKIAMRIDHNDGAVYMKQAYVQISGWPDFVFKKNYALRPLSEVKTYIDQNQHLPDMPSAEKVEKDGINLGEMNKALLRKVEEMTLYIIDLKAEKDRTEQDQKQKNQSLEASIKKLQEQIDKLSNKH